MVNTSGFPPWNLEANYRVKCTHWSTRGVITRRRAFEGSPRKCCVQERNCVFNNKQITIKWWLITYF